MNLELPDVALLSPADEVRLAQAIEAGVFAGQALRAGDRPCAASASELETLVELGVAAFQHFYLANLRLVANVAGQWARKAGLPMEELFQDGCVGLGEAVRRWDHRLGHRFSSLGYRMIESHVSGAAMVRCGQLDASRFQARAAFEVRRAWQRLESARGRSVGVSELAEHLGMDLGLVEYRLSFVPPVSLDMELPLAAHAQTDQGSEVPPEWLAALPREERQVLGARFGFDGPACTRVNLAERMGVSESTVRRIELRALARVRALVCSAA